VVARTHISISKRNYERAKKIKKRYARDGIFLTMEEALVIAASEDVEQKAAVGLGGWRI
jgi:hypothetical protein